MILPHPVTLKLSEDIYVGNNDFFGRGEGMGWHNHLLMFCLTDFFQIYEFHFDSKRTRRAQHKHMNVHSPPPFPIHVLVTVLLPSQERGCLCITMIKFSA